ncbi:MAG: outer membrane protein insertion porin family [Planctomycetota bacterium]|jgi:outer membrane protein insertion porin family
MGPLALSLNLFRGLFRGLFLSLFLGACQSALPWQGLPETAGFAVRYEGQAQLSERSLATSIALELEDWRSADFARPYADDAAYSLTQRYADQGFAAAKVNFRIEQEAGQPLLIFEIVEGPRTLLEGFSFPGFQTAGELTGADLESYYEAPRTGLTGRGKQVFVQSKVDALRKTLLNELRGRSFLEAHVGQAQVTFSEDRLQAWVSLELTAGAAYEVRELRYGGSEQELAEAGVDWKSLRQELGASPDEPLPFTPSMVHVLRALLLSELQEAGYPDARVDARVEIDRENPGVILHASATTGPKVHVSSVRIEGRRAGGEPFVKRRLELQAGDLAKASAVRDSISRLYRSGIFRRVSAELEGTGEERELVLNLEERSSREFFVEPGYGSYELLRLRLGFRDRDLWASGRGLRAEVTAAVRSQHALVGLTDPELFGARNAGHLTLDYDRREQPSFTSVASGLGAFVTHDWTDSSRRATTFGYQYRRSILEDVDVVTSEVQDAIDDLSLSGLRLSHREDRRNLPLFPSSGSLLELSSEWGDATLGSDLDYVRLTLAAAKYWPLDSGRVLAAGLRTGLIHSTDGSQTIPLQERFFLGGENSVRSYMESELGPTDSQDNPIGGEAFSLLSLELRQDVGSSGWQLASFMDMGNVVAETSSLEDLDNYGWALGVGVRYLLPVGPVRLDLGWNPDAHEDEDNLVLHLAVGLAF